jgi:D-sedoheptulose 7-phosphate isomerase
LPPSGKDMQRVRLSIETGPDPIVFSRGCLERKRSVAGETDQFIEEELGIALATIGGICQSAEYRKALVEVADAWSAALKRGNAILLAGNGGSAADCQHIAGELVGRFYFDRPGLPAIALTTDTSALTAIGNDHGFERIFARQVEALGRSGDVFVAISTSGTSPNILAAVAAARAKGMLVVGLTGRTGGRLRDQCDLCLSVPADTSPRIQEGHMVSYHLICALVERALFDKPRA